MSQTKITEKLLRVSVAHVYFLTHPDFPGLSPNGVPQTHRVLSEGLFCPADASTARKPNESSKADVMSQ
jgi:hypothetical protein